MKKFLLLSLLFILSPIVVRAATCDAGYYDNNGTCTRCINGYYCPGDGTMIACPPNPFTAQEISNLTGADLQSCEQSVYISSMARTNYPSDISDCFVALDAGYIDGCYFWQALYQYNATTGTYIQNMGARAFRTASPGYYLVNNYSGINYRACGQCTNVPTNAHYIGPGTPDVGNCPWVCDDGYYGKSENGDTACTLCPAGYACAGGVMTNCADVTGADGRATYTDAAGGASVCATCPAVVISSDLPNNEYQIISQQYYPAGRNNGIGGCLIFFMRYEDDGATSYRGLCYYSESAGVYGAADSVCQYYPPNTCAAGKYSTIESVAEWRSWGGTWARGINYIRGRVCTDVDAGYYSPDGDTAQHLCDTPPANAHITTACTVAANTAWACDAGYAEYNGMCEQLCTAGITTLRTSTGLVFNLYANKLTSPAVHVRPDGTDTVCYGNLAVGGANNAINLRIGDTTYHTTN